MRTCIECHESKPLNQFPVSGNSRRYSPKRCFECYRARRRSIDAAYRAEHRLEIRAYHLAWTHANPDRVRQYNQQWAAENPERVKLYRQVAKRVAYAVKTGKILRPTACDQCGAACIPQAAHEDYSRPYDIRWLCIPCHTTWDRDPKTVKTGS